MRALLLVAFLPGLFAQPSVTDPWANLRSKKPAGLDLSLRLIAPHPYHRGEVISLEAVIPNSIVDPRQGPAPEHWQFGGFLLDPSVDCGTLQKLCFGSNSLQFERNGITNIGQQSGPTSLTLNSYVPLLQPGHYRTAMLLRKLVLTNRSASSTTYGYPNPPEYALTNVVEFDVIPATRTWLQQTVAGAVATLRTADPQAYEVRKTASEQVRSLGSSDAWRAASHLLPTDETTLMQGLSAANQADWVCETLQTRISAPDQSVTPNFFNMMMQVCTQVHVPPPPPPSATTRPVEARISTTPPVVTGIVQPSPEQQAYFEKLRIYREELEKKSSSVLAASLPQKAPEPLADAFSTLLGLVQNSRNSRPPQPAPSWASGLTGQFLRSTGKIDSRRHYQLLSLFVSTMRSPELAPLLEAALDNWKPGDYYEAPQAALISLYQLDRARAQARILKELVQPKTWLGVQQLNLLPASAVPPMDDELIEALARAQRPGGWNAQLNMAALSKYATAKAAPRVRAIYESQQQQCQPELMAYFVRVDPDYADKVFHNHPWDMRVDPPMCTLQYFQRTSPLAMNAPLERYMAAYLGHVNVHVKTVAAQMLGRYGSKSAEASLWDAFRYFHEYWKDQRTQLPAYGEGASLEVALRDAIAHGRNWLADEAELRLIESLCISGQCMGSTRQDLEAWQQRPLRLEISDQMDARNRVAQYYGLENAEALGAKLAQFPRGTAFVMTSLGEAGQSLTEVRQLAERQGLILTDSR